jgi:hypothetical protein
VDGRYRVVTNAPVTIVEESSNTLTNGLVAYYKLDESSVGSDPVTRNDSWVNALHLTDNGTTTHATGVIGNAADLEASDSNYLESAADPAALDITDKLTVAAWFRAESGSGTIRYIASKYSTTSNQRGYAIYIGSGNEFTGVVSTNGTATKTVAATTFGPLSLNTWYHGVFVVDSTAGTLDVYVNGTLSNSDTFSNGINNSSAPFKIGGHTSTSSLFDGRVDEVLIYDRALTSDEVAQLYNGGSGYEIPLE